MTRFRLFAPAPTPTRALAKSRRPGPRIVRVLGVAVFTIATAGKVLAASMAEYALLLFLIVSASLDPFFQASSGGNAVQAVTAELNAAAQNAADAHLNGNRTKEIAGLAETIGLAKGALALASQCDACGELTAELQQVLGVATHLKALAQGGTGTCKPDGVIGRKEACDPLANPTGCPITTFETFCDDACECASPPAQVPCEFPFPAECDAQCDCQPVTIP